MELFSEAEADAIVTDDRRFIRVLEEKNIPFLIPTELIVALVASKQIKKSEGTQALQKMGPFVRKENYEYAIQCMEEEHED